MVWMRSLALVAAVLLAVAPTLSRLALSRNAAASEPMCTSAGLQPSHPAAETDPRSPPAHDDCGYCALLAGSSAALPSFALAIASPIVAGELPRGLQTPRLAQSPFPALGSRAPPAL